MIDPITWQILEDFPKNWDAYSRIVTHGITKWFPGKDKEGVLFTREERKSLRPSANTIGNAAIKALEHRNEANRLFSLLRVPENHPEWESKLNKIIKTRKY